MNSSDNPGPGNDGIQPWIDPDLEVRIVAAVVGEASDFERAELDRMLEAMPELAVFKRRIEAVHGLVGESYAQTRVSDDEKWGLAPERRERLLATLGLKSAASEDADAAEEAVKVTVIEPEQTTARWKIWVSCVSGVAAALVAVCALVLSLVQSRSSIVQSRFLATKEAAVIDSTIPIEPESTTFRSTDEWAYRPAPSAGLAEAPAAPVAATGSSSSYRETLRQLADATSLGETESLIARTERPTLQAGRGFSSSISSVNIDGAVKTSDEIVRRELALVPAQSQPARAEPEADLPTVTTGPAVEQDDKQVAAADVALGLPVMPAAMAQAAGESVDDQLVANAAVEYGSVSDGRSKFDAKNAPAAEMESKLAEVEPLQEFGDFDVAQSLGGAQWGSTAGRELDQPGIPELQVAQNDKDGDHFDRSAGQQSSDPANTDKFFFARSERELVEQSTLTRSGQETSVELARDFVEPAEYGINEPGGTVDAVEVVGKPVVPRYAISEPFSTAGKIKMDYEVLPFDYVKRADGLKGLLAADAELAANPDGYSINLAIEPEVVEFEGFVNDGGEAKGPEVREEAEKADVLWDTPQVEGVDELALAAAQPQSGEYQRSPGKPASTSLSSALSSNELEPSVAATSEDRENAEALSANVPGLATATDGMPSGGAETQTEWMSQPGKSQNAPVEDSGGITDPLLTEVTKEMSQQSDGQVKESSASVASFGDGAVVENLARGASSADVELFGSTLREEVRGLERQRATPSADTFDISSGVGHAPDGSLFRSEADVRFWKNERGLEGAIEEVGKAGVELAKAKAGNGEEVERLVKGVKGPVPAAEPAVAASKQIDDGSAKDVKMNDGRRTGLEEEAKALAEAEGLLNEFRAASVRKRIDLTLPKSAMSIEPHSSDDDKLNDATLEQLDALAADERRLEQLVDDGRQKLVREQELLERNADWKESGKEFAPVTTTEELASTNAFSTFSLNVSDVAFKLAQSALMKGEWPEPEKMRVEEFVNALDYGDPAPAAGEKVMCRTEQCAHPFMQQRNLLRIAMRTAAVGRGGGQPLRLTILLDNSGSMQREDREASVRRAMEVLTEQLQPNDQVSLLGFARTPRLLADRVSGSDGAKLLAAVDAAPSEGGTNLEEAMRLAGEVAQRQFDDGAVNRIVLMTDGAANLGNADPEELAKRVVELRQKGIAFDACGVGAKGLNDEVLEALTRKGDGRYYFLDAPEQADSGFASQLAGALRPAAKNVKVQVVFNHERVGAYRLLGYEKHRLNKEDFRNDAVDAAEMAAEETGVAVYQIEPMADGSGDVGEVRVRFQDVASGRMIEHHWIIPYEENAPTIEGAAPSIQLAGVAAVLGEYLRGGPEASNVDLDVLSSLAPGLRSAFGDNVRVNQLIGMIRDAQRAK